jgi:5'-nucleotidase
MKRKIVYVDMDNVLVDFKSGIEQLSEVVQKEYEGKLDEVPHIFSLMQPMPKAIESYKLLSANFDTYILSTAPWENHTAWHDKVVWVKKYLGTEAYKRLILTHNKHLNIGDYLIDDRPTHNGADKFKGEFIHFASAKYPDWDGVMNYLLPKE